MGILNLLKYIKLKSIAIESLKEAGITAIGFDISCCNYIFLFVGLYKALACCNNNVLSGVHLFYIKAVLSWFKNYKLIVVFDGDAPPIKQVSDRCSEKRLLVKIMYRSIKLLLKELGIEFIQASLYVFLLNLVKLILN